MNEDFKKMIALGVILFILTLFALHSIFTSMLNSKKDQTPLLSSPVETVDASASASVLEATLASSDSPLVVSIPTVEEINQSIEDRNQKRKAMEALVAARNIKAERVMASAAAALSSPVSQETAPEDTPPSLSPEARAERNKELRDGIKTHQYFPR